MGKQISTLDHQETMKEKRFFTIDEIKSELNISVVLRALKEIALHIRGITWKEKNLNSLLSNRPHVKQNFCFEINFFLFENRINTAPIRPIIFEDNLFYRE